MRQAIAAAMARSKREIPHYYLSLHDRLCAGRAGVAGRRERATRRRASGCLPGALLLKAVALALREVPAAERLLAVRRCDPSCHRRSTSAGRFPCEAAASLAPAIRDADRLSRSDQTDGRVARPGPARARTARIRGSEMMDPTVTVTSLGERGADSVFGVIYPPQLAIVGFGRIAHDGHRSIDGGIRPRPVRAGDPGAPITAPATAPSAAGCSPPSTSTCRSRRRYERQHDDRRGAARDPGRHRPRPRPRCRCGPTSISRNDIGLDSMDFLNFVIAAHQQLGVDRARSRLRQGYLPRSGSPGTSRLRRQGGPAERRCFGTSILRTTPGRTAPRGVPRLHPTGMPPRGKARMTGR